jgi:hypothetical protein
MAERPARPAAGSLPLRMDVIELVPRLHVVRLPVGHAYLWSDPDGLTLIDSGLAGSAPLIAGAILRAGSEPAELRRSRWCRRGLIASSQTVRSPASAMALWPSPFLAIRRGASRSPCPGTGSCSPETPRARQPKEPVPRVSVGGASSRSTYLVKYQFSG